MKLLNRTAAVFLSVIIILVLLAGCAKDTDETPQTDDPVSTPGIEFEPPEYIYQSKVIPFPKLPDDAENVRNVVLANNAVYFTASIPGNDADIRGVNLIFSMDVDGKNLEKLPDYTAALIGDNKTSGDVTINALHVDAGGDLWVVETAFFYNFEELDLNNAA